MSRRTSTTRSRSPTDWKGVIGVRYDHYSASLTNSINQPPSANQTVNYTSVRAGVIFQPTETQSYYFSYGTSFNPVARDTRAHERPAVARAGDEPPVRARRQVGRARRQPVADRRALQHREGQYPLADLPRRLRAHRQRPRARLPAERRGRVTSNWQVFGGYTYLDAEIVKASVLDNTQGKVPANTPKNSFSMWTTYNFTREWQAGTGVTYMSDRFTSNTNAVKVPTTSAGMRWSVTSGRRGACNSTCST
jgi:catecholate siderophore receptor